MVCDHCHERDAVVQLTSVENNAVRQLHLCERCAAERGVETTIASPKHPLGEFLQQQLASASTDATKCSFCNATMADFRANGQWGCARCYTNFEAAIRELLRRVQGNHRHIGRTYAVPASESLERAAVLGELRDRLRRAIDTEQFELAADLRDRIRVME
ncbi:MAG TPA: UvrB/UvrC motif-containing protein [Gemmatimonadaceae bacterium]|jgi:protein arginine kinase activator|nr:UvrB/UvrC motif-containing protein [Gemmatimonadaceae bacterium]